MKKQLTKTKRQRFTSQDANKKFEKIVKLRREKFGESLKDAMSFVRRRYPQIWKRIPSARAFEDIDFLAHFLNTRGDAEMSRLLEPIVNWETASSGDVQKAAESLAKRMEDLKTTCYAHCAVGKKPFFLWSVLGHPFYRKISTSLQTGNFWKLKQCRFCKAFFVSEDHRAYYCPKKRCREEHRKSEAKKGMKDLRNREHQEKQTLATKFLEDCKTDKSILDYLGYKGEQENTINKIRDGFEKGWSAQKIAKGLSGQGRNWFVREYPKVKYKQGQA